MPRVKATTTIVRELSKTLSPEQMRALADELVQEASKPRVDKRQYARCVRAAKAAYIRAQEAEEKLAEILTAAGKTNDEINAEFAEIRRAADRERAAGPAVRRRKAQ